MELSYLTEESINYFIKTALNEDIGDGDHSSLAAIPEDSQSEAKMLIKDEGVLAGIELAIKIFNFFDPSLSVIPLKKDGDIVKNGDIGLIVKGSARSILTCERVVLNCLQRMSGIATYTNHLCKLIKGTQTQLLDTRKTTPNFRLPEKWAVAIGGAKNHRFALYDMIMLKDNHIDYAGGIKNAIHATKNYLQDTGKSLKVEIETRNLDEVKEVLATGDIDIIMLDNMMPSVMKEAVRLIDGQYKTEASGGITEKSIREVAECGVDYISVGALTHSAKSLDISLKAT
ncbi:carboxylating nicotinate-nucleotide diphosphorylase [Fulvivirga sediminis]|uniref:Probable nicotinate-nucleotide pyrophosphorylase [carboxylating] n=1 Tax=Fulvivirga sediminis TaxID=2803949 RepID=A0A937F6D4_9BACT|nr:carboxylating nicotinate-nucleotide diphosphorylase [Fulvivirga sediminis]MBL3654913.1 carboxylating nicotinate-nucleotide diphosphorylase [Fulvivirga sediminis]